LRRRPQARSRCPGSASKTGIEWPSFVTHPVYARARRVVMDPKGYSGAVHSEDMGSTLLRSPRYQAVREASCGHRRRRRTRRVVGVHSAIRIRPMPRGNCGLKVVSGSRDMRPTCVAPTPHTAPATWATAKARTNTPMTLQPRCRSPRPSNLIDLWLRVADALRA